MESGGNTAGKAEDRFERLVLPVIFDHEGRKYSNHPHDAGGPTKYGVSLKFAQQYGDRDGDGKADLDLDGDGDVDADDIKLMTPEVAAVVYRSEWWGRYGYDRILDVGIATKVMSLAINLYSAKLAHRLLQRALRACGHPVQEDGVLGDISIKAINSQPGWLLLAAFRSEAAGHYRMIYERRKAAISLGSKNPPFDAFIEGWLNRAYS